MSPLNLIIIDLLNTLKKLNIKGDILKDSFNNESLISNLFLIISSEVDIKNVSDDFKKDFIEALFSHPEALLGDTGRGILKCDIYQKNCCCDY